MARVSIAIVAGLIALGSVACGGGTPASEGTPATGISGTGTATEAGSTPTGAGAGDCSSYLTEAEVSQAVGVTVGPPTENLTDAGGGITALTCQWMGESFAVANLVVGRGPADYLRSSYEDNKAGQEGEDVAGLGDEAYFSPTIGELGVLTASAYISVSAYSDPDPSQTLPASRQLATLVLERL